MKKYTILVCSTLYTKWDENGNLLWDEMDYHKYTVEASKPEYALNRAKDAHPHCVFKLIAHQ